MGLERGSLPDWSWHGQGQKPSPLGVEQKPCPRAAGLQSLSLLEASGRKLQKQVAQFGGSSPTFGQAWLPGNTGQCLWTCLSPWPVGKSGASAVPWGVGWPHPEQDLGAGEGLRAGCRQVEPLTAGGPEAWASCARVCTLTLPAARCTPHPRTLHAPRAGVRAQSGFSQRHPVAAGALVSARQSLE